MTNNSTGSTDPHVRTPETPMPEGVDEPTGDPDFGESVEVAFTTLIDLGASLAGLRDLAERQDSIGIGVTDREVESLERVIISLVEQLGVGVKLAEVSTLHQMRNGASGAEGEGEPRQRLSDHVFLEEVLDPNFPPPVVDCTATVRSKAEGATRNGSAGRS